MDFLVQKIKFYRFIWAGPPESIPQSKTRKKTSFQKGLTHVYTYADIFFHFRRHLVNERNREEFDEVSNRRLTSMALDVSRGLSYLAELKYVHRDLACRNCLVNSTRVVKLADFGMTRPMFENDYYR